MHERLHLTAPGTVSVLLLATEFRQMWRALQAQWPHLYGRPLQPGGQLQAFLNNHALPRVQPNVLADMQEIQWWLAPFLYMQGFTDHDVPLLTLQDPQGRWQQQMSGWDVGVRDDEERGYDAVYEDLANGRLQDWDLQLSYVEPAVAPAAGTRTTITVRQPHVRRGAPHHVTTTDPWAAPEIRHEFVGQALMAQSTEYLALQDGVQLRLHTRQIDAPELVCCGCAALFDGLTLVLGARLNPLNRITVLMNDARRTGLVARDGSMTAQQLFTFATLVCHVDVRLWTVDDDGYVTARYGQMGPLVVGWHNHYWTAEFVPFCALCGATVRSEAVHLCSVPDDEERQWLRVRNLAATAKTGRGGPVDESVTANAIYIDFETSPCFWDLQHPTDDEVREVLLAPTFCTYSRWWCDRDIDTCWVAQAPVGEHTTPNVRDWIGDRVWAALEEYVRNARSVWGAKQYVLDACVLC